MADAAPILGAFGTWQVSAPPGLTDLGKLHKFQQNTVERLRAQAEQISGDVWQELVATVRNTYTEGTGGVAAGLQRPALAGDSSNISVVFNYSGPSHIVFLTALAGLPVASPGHLIPHAGTSRFFWRSPLYGLPPGIYSFSARKPAFWRPRRGAGDVISDVLAAGAQRFQDVMIAENNAAVVEFVQNDLAPVTRTARVSVAAGSGIGPQ